VLTVDRAALDEQNVLVDSIFTPDVPGTYVVEMVVDNLTPLGVTVRQFVIRAFSPDNVKPIARIEGQTSRQVIVDTESVQIVFDG